MKFMQTDLKVRIKTQQPNEKNNIYICMYGWLLVDFFAKMI